MIFLLWFDFAHPCMMRAKIFPWRLFEFRSKELVMTFATERYFLPRVGRSITTLNIQGWAEGKITFEMEIFRA